MHPKLPTPSFEWLNHDDLGWISNVHVCGIVSPPELSSQTAIMYYFNNSLVTIVSTNVWYFFLRLNGISVGIIELKQ